MSEPVLVIPRRVAIELLHAAQVAQPEPIHGIVVSRNGSDPAGFRADGEPPREGEQTWARLWSHPQAPAVPSAAELRPGQTSLVISLNTKGVLEMRAWRLADDEPREITLKIREQEQNR